MPGETIEPDSHSHIGDDLGQTLPPETPDIHTGSPSSGSPTFEEPKIVERANPPRGESGDIPAEIREMAAKQPASNGTPVPDFQDLEKQFGQKAPEDTNVPQTESEQTSEVNKKTEANELRQQADELEDKSDDGNENTGFEEKSLPELQAQTDGGNHEPPKELPTETSGNTGEQDNSTEEDTELQQRLKEAGKAQAALIENLEKMKNAPGVAEAIQKLETARDNLIQEEKKRYEAEQAEKRAHEEKDARLQQEQQEKEQQRLEMVEKIKERTVARIAATVAGEFSNNPLGDNVNILDFAVDSDADQIIEKAQLLPSDDETREDEQAPGVEVRQEEMEELLAMTYGILGVERPSDTVFNAELNSNGDVRSSTAEVKSNNIPGIVIKERRVQLKPPTKDSGSWEDVPRTRTSIDLIVEPQIAQIAEESAISTA
jgi:hypothetical protein